MKRFLMVILLSIFTNIAMATEDDAMTDQQRCEEWAAMDSIHSDNINDYVTECLSSLQHDVYETDDDNEEGDTDAADVNEYVDEGVE
jgi:hypothetical protein